MTIKELSQELERIQEKLQIEGVDAFKQYFKESLFDSNPKLKSFTFYQYADFWCDGGPCSFYIQLDEYQVIVNGKTAEDEGWNERLFKAVYDVLEAVEPDIFRRVFGSDQKITVSKGTNGSIIIDNEEYGDHD